MNRPSRIVPSCVGLCLSAGLLWLLTACASPTDSVYFITKTSTSVVDADTMPSGISFGYDRVEGYAGPRYADGSVFPVASAIESKGRGINREVRQSFATGDAALIVTRPERENAISSASMQSQAAAIAGTAGAAPNLENAKRKAVFFGTTTSAGLKVGFDTTSPMPTSFTLGYKRKELAVIPVDQKLTNTSVLGSFTSGAGVGVAAAAPDGAASAAAAAPAAAAAAAAPAAAAASVPVASVRFDVQQFFATGQAAENLATLDSIRSQFQDKAKEAIGGVAVFRKAEASQGRLALDALVCVNKLTAARFERVLANSEALGMFGPLGGVAAIRAASGEEARRQKYMSFMSLLDVDDGLAAERLALHKATVCEWAKAPA